MIENYSFLNKSANQIPWAYDLHLTLRKSLQWSPMKATLFPCLHLLNLADCKAWIYTNRGNMDRRLQCKHGQSVGFITCYRRGLSICTMEYNQFLQQLIFSKVLLATVTCSLVHQSRLHIRSLPNQLHRICNNEVQILRELATLQSLEWELHWLILSVLQCYSTHKQLRTLAEIHKHTSLSTSTFYNS